MKLNKTQQEIIDTVKTTIARTQFAVHGQTIGLPVFTSLVWRKREMSAITQLVDAGLVVVLKSHSTEPCNVENQVFVVEPHQLALWQTFVDRFEREHAEKSATPPAETPSIKDAESNPTTAFRCPTCYGDGIDKYLQSATGVDVKCGACNGDGKVELPFKSFIVELRSFQNGALRGVRVPASELTGATMHDLDRVFFWGQNDFQPVVGKCSVSVGDVIAYNGDDYMVEPVGFKKIEKPSVYVSRVDGLTVDQWVRARNECVGNTDSIINQRGDALNLSHGRVNDAPSGIKTEK